MGHHAVLIAVITYNKKILRPSSVGGRNDAKGGSDGLGTYTG